MAHSHCIWVTILCRWYRIWNTGLLTRGSHDTSVYWHFGSSKHLDYCNVGPLLPRTITTHVGPSLPMLDHHYLCWTITTYVGPSLPMLDHHYLCWAITTYVGPSLPMLGHHYLCWTITTYVGPSLPMLGHHYVLPLLRRTVEWIPCTRPVHYKKKKEKKSNQHQSVTLRTKQRLFRLTLSFFVLFW